jgi:hypothetical protein
MRGQLKGFMNPDNSLAIELTQKTRIAGPSLRTIGKWREEWVSSGNDKRMTFQTYKKGKCKKWHKEKRLKAQTK